MPTTSTRLLLPYTHFPLLVMLLLMLLLAGCTHGPTETVETDTIIIPGPWTFEPQRAQITPGTTVTWQNDGSHDHTVTFETPDGAPFDAVLAPGESTEYTFDQVGSFDYECRFHLPDMTGTIIVEQNPDATTGNVRY